MAGRRILYAVLVGAAVLFQIFFRFYLSTFVLVLILVLPILSLLLALPGWMGSMASVVPQAPLITVGGSARFGVLLYHSSFLPLIRPRIRLHWTNQLTGESGESKITVTARKPAELTVAANHCGRLVCQVEKAVCCDLLGLFPLPVRKGPERAVLILPAQLELEGKEELAAGENAGTVLRPRPGGGPGEDYDLREYRVGDPLRSVRGAGPRLCPAVGSLPLAAAAGPAPPHPVGFSRHRRGGGPGCGQSQRSAGLSGAGLLHPRTSGGPLHSGRRPPAARRR